ncbi:MAG: cache domain-containing protein [Proteobacteria bacterium]|nr:cache domain-containing protein [Pseudomonadota bacterium]MBU1389697.1 cache domain-containing protein [Pseudomonadota bacterium]MBU1542635.1 cache domain-containing protein [Pseudomonadota bacterium]MBU2479537.1 cache domain-containing protein [Pseudomonadota bacterium]
MNKKYSLSRVLLKNMLLCSILSMAVISCLWAGQQYLSFRRGTDIIRERMLESHKNFLELQVQKSVEYIEYNKSLTRKRLNDSIRNRVYEAHTMATHLHEKWKGEKTKQDIQAAIKESMRMIRFNQDRGYFFILELGGTNQLLSDQPDFEGKNMLEIPDEHKAEVARNIIHLVLEKNEGFQQYNWPKPGHHEEYSPKITFVKLFKPYNWIIGTGEYLDEFESGVKTDVLNYIETIRFNTDGYIFVGQWDGLSLVEPAKGENMLGTTDVNGVKIVQELIALSKSNGGFLRYVMPKFKGRKPDPKLSYVQGIKDWKWYVGAGMYIDDIDEAIMAKQHAVIQELIKNFIQITGVLIILVAFVYFIAKHTFRNVRDNFQAFTEFFENGAISAIPIDPDKMKYTEFEKLAYSANAMIEDRNIAQSNLIQSEKKHRLIVENLNDFIIKLDRSKNLIFASPNYFKLFDKPGHDFLNQPFLSLVQKEEQNSVAKALNSLDQYPYASCHEEHALTRFGWQWIAWSTRAVLDTQGRPIEYVAVGRDITEKKKAEETLKENQQWLQTILDSIQAGIIVIEPGTHKILELNRAALEMIGAEKEQIIDTVCHEYLCPDQCGRCPVTDPGLSIAQSDSELIKADGTRIPILRTVNSAIINGQLVLIESFLDMQDKRKLETMLLQAQKMEAIGTLSGGIAHDFNNILSGIFGYTELALMNPDDRKKIRKYLQLIKKGAKRASDLVQQILTFSRQIKHQMLPVTVSVLVKEALDLIRSSIPSSIEIQTDIISQAKIMADPSQIHQVIMNLCTNAYQSMNDNSGVLSVRLHEIENSDPGFPPGKYLLLEIEDTGCGMDKETLLRAFDPYFTTKEIGKGTGLGLSTVDGIVKKHNGFIKIHSDVGKGTVFQVYFPVIEHEDLPESLEKNEELFLTGTERILLVDDEPDILNTYKAILNHQGYEVTTFTSSKSALDRFAQNPDEFDLVITDMTMPDLTGDKLSQKILKLRSDIPIIICTGHHETFTREKAIEIGIKKYIVKPVSLMEFSKAVRDLLDIANP